MKSPILLLILSLVALAAGCAALTPAPPPDQNAEIRLDRGLAALEAGRYTQAFDDLVWVYTQCSGRTAGSRALIALAALELDPRNRAGRPAVGTELLGRVIRDPGTPDWLRPLSETAFLAGLSLGAPHPDGIPAPAPVADSAMTADTLARADSLTRADSLENAEPTAPADSVNRAEPLDLDSLHHAAPEPDASTAGIERKGPPQRAVPDPAPASLEPAFGCGPQVGQDGVDRTASALPTLPGPPVTALLAQSQAVRDSAAGRADALQQELAAVRERLEATEAELERIRKTLKP